MWWLIAVVLVLLALGAIPIGAHGCYNSSGAGMFLLIGPLKIKLNKEKKNKKTRKVKDSDFASLEVKRETSLIKRVARYKPLVKPVFRFLIDFKKKLRVKDLRLKVILAGDDPGDLSINYGRTWIALGNLMPHLERFFVIKKRNLEIECDYLAEKTTADFSITLTITVFRLLQIAVYHGFSILREYYKIINNTKDGVAL